MAEPGASRPVTTRHSGAARALIRCRVPEAGRSSARPPVRSTTRRRSGIRLRAKHLLCLWLLGFLASLAIQGAFPGWFAGVTAWGRNVGWQTEIAIWNAGVSVLIAGLLRQSEAAQSAAIPGLALLSLAFGINHLQAAIAQPDRLGNWLGAGANLAAVLLAALYYLTPRRTSAG